METGSRRPTLRDVCALYTVDESVTAERMKLTREAWEPGWWTQYEDLNLSPYIGLEQGACSITSYSMHHVHGLAQTEDYTRAIIKAIAPKMDPAIHQQRVEAQLRRQQLLEGESPPHCRLLLDEAVLHRPVGDPVLIIVQLENILELISSGKVTLQVIPFGIGAYSVADIDFTLLEFNEPALPPVVFVERPSRWSVLRAPA